MTAALTPAQPTIGEQERRERILAAILELAAEGGYEAVQLREVSARSNVALRTIYKYYGAREPMIGEAMAQWQNQLVRDAHAHMKGANFIERMCSNYKFMFDAFRKQPMMFDTLASLQRHGGGAQSFGASSGCDDAEFAQMDAQFRADFIMIVGSTLYSALHFCVYGGQSFREGWAQIERTIRRLAT